MAPITTEDFPQELVDEIIDGIPDNETLLALSLVSHLFLPGSQRRLFASITISTGTTHNYRSDNEEGTSTPSLATKLLQALTESPHLAPYTKELIVLNNQGQTFDARGEVTEGILPKILPLFEYLERFVLKQVDQYHRYTTPAFFRAVAKTLQLPSLVYVDLKDVPMDIIHQCSSSVKRIAIWNPTLEGNSNLSEIFPLQSTTIPGQGHPKLESLLIDDASSVQISGQNNETAITWVLQSNLDVTHLQKLIISVMHCQVKTHAEVSKLLRACPKLTELSFAPTLGALEYKARREVDPIDLGALKALKTLHLSVQSGFWSDGRDPCEPIPWICRLLEKIPPSNLIETIVISSSFGMLPTNQSSPNSDYFGVDFKSYPQLDKILNKQNFPKLKQVRFHVEEAPFFKDYVSEDKTFKVRADWVKNQIRVGMGRLRVAQLIRFSSSLAPYRRKLSLDSDW